MRPLFVRSLFFCPNWNVGTRKRRQAQDDVGRHNAINKLIGTMMANGLDPSDGVFLSTARCSYEIVEKVVRAGGTTLVTVSLPTSLAVSRAASAGLSLLCLARDDSFLALDADFAETGD